MRKRLATSSPVDFLAIQKFVVYHSSIRLVAEVVGIIDNEPTETQVGLLSVPQVILFFLHVKWCWWPQLAVNNMTSSSSSSALTLVLCQISGQ